MNNFESLIHELGDLIDLPLTLDRHRSCHLVLDDQLHLQIEHHSLKNAVMVAALIAPLPPGAFRENVLKDALKANHTFAPHRGAFAYIEKTTFLTLFDYLGEKELTAQYLLDRLTQLKEDALQWQSAISAGRTSPPGYFDSPQFTGGSLVNMFKKL